MTEQEAIEIHIAENIRRIEVIEDFMHTNYNHDDAVCGKNISVLSKINGLLQMVQQYRAIGTVEECRAAVEKQKEIRNKAIDDFEEKLLENAPKNYAGTLELGGMSCYLSANKVKQIAEKLKGGAVNE